MLCVFTDSLKGLSVMKRINVEKSHNVHALKTRKQHVQPAEYVLIDKENKSRSGLDVPLLN